MELKRFARLFHQPLIPLGKNGRMVTGCRSHFELAKEAATEGTVLLKNDGTLPLAKGAKICLFGLGAGDFQFGGGGSGFVHSDNRITLAAGLKAAAENNEIEFFDPLVDYYETNLKEQFAKAHKEYPAYGDFSAWKLRALGALVKVPEKLYKEAVSFGDTAVFCLSRYSTEGDDNGDRRMSKGDFYLFDEEKELLCDLCRDFAKVVVVINSCGPVSTLEYKNNDKVGAVLYPLYGGGPSGEALCDILLGKSYPSGHLQHTLAAKIEEHPGAATMHEGDDYVNYTEDIFVGYRYFESFAPEKVSYPFGFGLGYTEFEIKAVSAVLEKFTAKFEVSVKNIGGFKGKEVVQAYLTAPQGKLGKAKKVLSAFAKTRELAPGEEAIVKIGFDIRSFASFDDLGKIEKSAFILEKGEYSVSLGNNVRDTEKALEFKLDEDIICRRCHPYMAPKKLAERLCADGTMEKLPEEPAINMPKRRVKPLPAAPEKPFTLAEALEKGKTEEFIASLSDKEMGELLYGHPMMNVSTTNGIGAVTKSWSGNNKQIPLIPTSDGPMGIRVAKGSGVSPTYFPCENAVSQTWNLAIAKRVGAAIAKEAKENNIGIWLAPAMNIHRTPLCGRNFEYFSEDPLTTGLFAASYVSGVQEQNIAATVKHFCCNNRENKRRIADSRVSQRALREIYLRGFEIAIKKSDPWALMTSYNPVNGEQSSKNSEAINGILRGEWKYNGVVMTDWRTLSNVEEELRAGGDVKMPVAITTFYKDAPESFEPDKMMAEGTINRKAVIESVRRIINLMGHLE